MAEQDEIIDALGGVALEIGEPDFHLRLFDLIGTLLPHEMGWIVRYGGTSEPDVLHTKHISSAMVHYYLQAQPQASDPYLCSWRSNASARVETMADALPRAIDRNFYSSDFIKRFEFTDELAIYLPCSGSSAISLFLERRDARFSEADLSRVEHLFPALLNFHRAHIRSSFTNMSGAMAGRRTIEDSAACVVDRTGTLVFATEKWRDLGKRSERIRHLACSPECPDLREQIAGSDVPLRVVSLDRFNPIAPGGLIVHHDEPMPHGDGDSRSDAIVGRLTPREKDIVALTFDGLSTGAIAQRLRISKGSIKNCRLRMYRKFGVSSERELIALLMPVSAHLKDLLQRRQRG